MQDDEITGLGVGVNPVYEMYNKLKQENTKLKELLKKIYNSSENCPICNHWKYSRVYTKHSSDCAISKELEETK